MELKIYQVDAFTDKIFSGNPTAVCPLDEWPEDALLQQIAMENNLAETAFCRKHGEAYEIRWFTPTVEVDLCGHATLAAALVLFGCGHAGDTIHFYSPRSGSLIVSRQGDDLSLNFPADIFEQIELFPELTNGFDITPTAAFRGKTDYMLVFGDETQIRRLIPDFNVLRQLDGRGIIVTAQGDHSDFVSRFFAPQSGINEDPVTGSAHTTLAPYWAKQSGRNELTAFQLSPRGGQLRCRHLGDRVEITGQGKLYLEGTIYVG